MGIFSTTHIHPSKTEYVTRQVNVTEKRAPTDDSIRLLNEMQEKAKSNIIATISVEENYLQAVGVYYSDDLIEHRMTFHIKFIVNGKEYLMDGYIDKFSWSKELSSMYLGFGNEAVFKLVHKRLSEIIALQLMKECPDFLDSIK